MCFKIKQACRSICADPAQTTLAKSCALEAEVRASIFLFYVPFRIPDIFAIYRNQRCANLKWSAARAPHYISCRLIVRLRKIDKFQTKSVEKESEEDKTPNFVHFCCQQSDGSSHSEENRPMHP